MEGDQSRPDRSVRASPRRPRKLRSRTSRRPKKSEEAKTKEAESKKPKTQEEQETMRPPDRRAITTISPSTLKAGVIWVGTNNGLVQVTTDNGANWQNVSPPGLQKFSEMTMVEASHFDRGHRLRVRRQSSGQRFQAAHLRTSDYGKTWQEVVTGIPDFSFVKVVREDPKRKGLLYAGTENGRVRFVR